MTPTPGSDHDPTARRVAVRAGLTTAWPLALAALPFGLVYGTAVAESRIAGWVGIAGSWLVIAGAAQLSLVSLIDADAAWTVAVGTALVINARFVLYSAALAPAFSEFPHRWRWGLPYLMTDQAASMGLAYFETEQLPYKRRWFFLSAGLLFTAGWWVGTVAGVALGATIPAGIDIAFAVPAMFIALLVPNLTGRPAIVAAIVAAATTVIAAPLPNGLNIIVGALAGIAVGRTALRPEPTS